MQVLGERDVSLKALFSEPSRVLAAALDPGADETDSDGDHNAEESGGPCFHSVSVTGARGIGGRRIKAGCRLTPGGR